ncbi:hypothetical protein TNCV_946431 [Trichonephila clavipes]|nr:hypothetical protein TNCV_946431 [Trichonephila clavipes]
MLDKRERRSKIFVFSIIFLEIEPNPKQQQVRDPHNGKKMSPEFDWLIGLVSYEIGDKRRTCSTSPPLTSPISLHPKAKEATAGN